VKDIYDEEEESREMVTSGMGNLSPAKRGHGSAIKKTST
jgi:hypothetical protein